VDPAPLSWLKEDLPGILQAGLEEFPPLYLALRHFQKDRDQYLADGLLADLAGVNSGPMLCLGITGADLFSPGMNFVFGLACTGTALIFTFRLRPEMYGGPANLELYHWRVVTEAVHNMIGKGEGSFLPAFRSAGMSGYDQVTTIRFCSTVILLTGLRSFVPQTVRLTV
jgi:archaemetzincin